MAALTIRKDRTPVMLRKLAKAEEDARVGRRMLAIANALDGMSREAAAQAAGMDRQTLRDWVIPYNENGIDGLLEFEQVLAVEGQPVQDKVATRLRIHARGPGADLREAVRQDHASCDDGSFAAKHGPVATEGAPQPPAERPGLAGGL